MAKSPILFQSEDGSVTLIDIPQSISAAQGIPEDYAQRTILSSRPLTEPYPSHEPKTAAARASVLGKVGSVELRLREEYANLIKSALEKISASHKGDWCLPRCCVEEVAPRPGEKRKLPDDDPERFQRNDGTSSTNSSPPPEEDESEPSASNATTTTTHPFKPPDSLLLSLARPTPWTRDHKLRLYSGSDATPGFTSFIPFELITSPNPFDPSVFTITTPAKTTKSRKPSTRPRSPSACTTTHVVEHPRKYNYILPPDSSFHLSSCDDPLPFHKAVHFQALAASSETETKSTRFDFVLLDPPWPSRSVKRTHRTPGSTYRTISTLAQTRDLLLGLGLDSLLAETDGWVGVWVTNNMAVRDVVLGEGGLFESLGCELQEEWVWAKVTTKGEPVTELGGVWKMPWEVLLVGRRKASGGEAGEEGEEHGEAGAREVKRRVLIGVPDLHSRKPCLKVLVEEMDGKAEPRVLEVFARYGVAGWWSWGDECLKFNWEGCWMMEEDE